MTPKVGYAALSHCWGKVQPVRLMKTNVAALKGSIAIASLPKTFQDAIAVTRRLQLRYIWIDSLYKPCNPPLKSFLVTQSRCIIQDDPKDWNRESSRMRDVYRNATFCIAATAAEHGGVGLFFDRDIQVLTPI
jgi:hypothetical protein